MRFLDRVSTLVKADAHGVIDQLEERSLLLKQHLREAELEVDRKRARLEALDEEEARLGEDAQRLESQVRALDEDVELALAGGKEELARFSVRKLLPRRGDLEALCVRRAEIGEARAQLAERLAEQQEGLDALRTRVRARLAAAPDAGSRPFETAAAAVADEEVELELLRRRRSTGGGE